MKRDAATERQVLAADPSGSVWLSANAGSGKTRVLTDRVARLLLDDVEPQRILCLTYTKAAATEMQNRLFRRLGEWAMCADGPLRAQLSLLGVDSSVDAGTLARARRLFARAIETPGGLRIQTIHSFCASILRRFPLEAGVPPQFRELDDRSARLLREEVIELLASAPGDNMVAAAARTFTGEDFSKLTESIARQRDAFTTPLTETTARALFGLPDSASAETVLAQVFLGDEADLIAGLRTALLAGSKQDTGAAAKLAGLDLAAPTLATLAALEGVFLTGSSAAEPFAAKIGSFPTKATRAAMGPLLDRVEALMLRVEAARGTRISLQAAEKALVLHRLAGAFLPEYDRRKARRGLLDFDDLIVKARRLLSDTDMAQWVLFRLDGGIDHILVDEAQDTSPDQWRVIELLAQEFTAGQGARDAVRTIFVVGDKKQSIYSFQGADLHAFDRMRDHFALRLKAAKVPLRDLTLQHSFRSSRAILRLVDGVFDPQAGADLRAEVKHVAFHAELPGRVDLWPPVPETRDPDPEHWYDPTDLPTDEHHTVKLANAVAAEIRQMIDSGTLLPARGDHPGRPVEPGDVLILVQRRAELFSELIRACKAAGLPIAGADRLKLGAEMAVKDLAAVLSFLSTPEDDLSLAAALRSPIFGWSEAQLYDLAHGRPGYLWEALRTRAEDHPETLAILNDLRAQADFLRPFDLIDRILTRHDARRRFLARLGPECEDGIDEFLSQALAYEAGTVPSLTGFLTWLSTDDATVKRQTDSASNRIRVMTVHGAKGLEAPIVILPDTGNRKMQDRDDLITLADGSVVWRMSGDDKPPAMAAATAAQATSAAEENLRLLYVALTRAECWLIVAAAGKASDDSCWHRLVQRGLARAGAVEDPATGRMRLQAGDWPAPDATAPRAPVAGTVALPDWARRPPPSAPETAPPLSPSDLGGAKIVPDDPGLGDEEAAKRWGRLVHLLLEHLPGVPADARAAQAAALLSAGPDPATAAETQDALAEVAACLDHPDLAEIFAPGGLAEVPVTARLGDAVLFGTIDRLMVFPDRVLAIDFKSNRIVPDRPEDVPDGILRQMAAYASALAQIYPGRRIDTAILWTKAARLMPLPPDLVTGVLQTMAIP